MKGVGFPNNDTMVGASRGLLVAVEIGRTGHESEALASALAWRIRSTGDAAV
jgi:hypothetical protein